MKKSISVFLVLSMLISCVAFACPANALATSSDIDYKEALLFETAPTIDGYISTAEWGQHTVFVEAWDCATIDDTTPYHSFFYNRINATDRDDYGDFSYYIWLRWDLNKFYIGVKVNEPNVHSLKNGTTNTWNGDAVQTRIDKNGANAVVNGGDFTVTADRKKPWSSTSVPDFIFGYVQIAGGFSEAWENVSNQGMTSFSNNFLGVTQCVVAPAGSDYSTDTKAGITTYEIAIPWSYIYNGEYESLLMIPYKPGRGDGPRGAIGKEFGMSLVVLDDGADASAGWDAFMSWGSGICGTQQDYGAAACAGSNSVVLVETPVSQSSSYKTYDPSPLLDAKFSTSGLDPAGVYYDYLAGDTYKSCPVTYDSLSSLTYNDPADLSVWGAPEYMGSVGSAKDAIGADTYVLDYRDPTIDQSYIDTRDGTTEYRYPTSYTFEFDIMYTGVELFAEGYASELYNWFGGSNSYTYQCGYFFNDSAFKIVNSNDPNEVIARYSYNLKKDTWYNWKFQYDNDSCNARLWIDDLSTDADNEISGTVSVPGYTGDWGTLVINTNWRYFYYSSEKALCDGTLLIFRKMNTQVMFDNVKIYNFTRINEPECLHKNEIKEIIPATCTSAESYRWICADCGELLRTSGPTTGTPIGHLKPAIVGRIDATCTQEGYTGDNVCQSCGETISYGIPIAANGHSLTDGHCTVCGEDVPYDGIAYEIVDGEVHITGYFGSTSVLNIPSEIEGCPVTAITEGAFKAKSVLEKVIIPDTVTVMGDNAFERCKNLKKIKLSSSLTTIEANTFIYCEGLEYVEIPDGVTSIGESAFCYCLSLSEVSLPQSLEYIDNDAFYLCPALTTVYYNESEENFGEISISGGNEKLLSANILYNTTRYILGDLNDDGKVSGIDSNIIKRIILGVINADNGSDLYASADVNGDGSINSLDSNIIKRIICGRYV